MAVTDRDAAPRYGKALFEVAQEQDQLQAVHEEVNELQAVLKQTPELLSALTSKNLTAADKDQLLSILLQSRSDLVAQLVGIVQANGRLGGLAAVFDDFEARYDAANGIVKAVVTTAVAMSDSQLQAIKQAIATKLNAQAVEVTPVIDQSIVGGVKVVADDVVIDGTVATRLAQLRATLLSN